MAPEVQAPGRVPLSLHRALAGRNGRGGAPGQERATSPFCIERLLEGALLTHQRSICGAALEPANQGERPLRSGRDQVGGGQCFVAAAPRPAARCPPTGYNCDSHTHSPHDLCHATMVRNSHLNDKNFV